MTSKLSERELALLPTDADVEHYGEHGWFMSGRIYNDEELEQFQLQASRHYQGYRDRELPARPPGLAAWTPADGDVQRMNDYIHYENEQIRRLLCKPVLGAIAARLSGASAIRLFTATLLYKPVDAEEGTNIVPWHYDKYYWNTCSSDRMLTAFVPFHDCFEEHGTLQMIDGSHHWVDRSAVGDDHPDSERLTGRLGQLQRVAEANNARISRTPMLIPRGHVSFHHCQVFHGSGDNVSDRPRQAISLHLQDDSNHYVPYARNNGRRVPYKHDGLVRRTADGLPDYGDPQYCPTLWSE